MFQDNVPPTPVNYPGTQTVQCGSVPGLDTVSTLDCDPSPAKSLNVARVDGACPFNYTLQRNLTLTDNCGNTGVYAQTLTVIVRMRCFSLT